MRPESTVNRTLLSFLFLKSKFFNDIKHLQYHAATIHPFYYFLYAIKMSNAIHDIITSEP